MLPQPSAMWLWRGLVLTGGTLLGVGCILTKAPILPVREWDCFTKGHQMDHSGPQSPLKKKLGCYENDIPQHKASLFSWWAAKSSPPSLPKHNTPWYQIFKQTDTLAAYQSFVTPQALRIKEGARLTKPNVGFCLFACGELHRSLFAWLA